jgi:hypothetical protein
MSASQQRLVFLTNLLLYLISLRFHVAYSDGRVYKIIDCSGLFELQLVVYIF